MRAQDIIKRKIMRAQDIIETLKMRYDFGSDRSFNAFIKTHGEMELIKRREIKHKKISKFKRRIKYWESQLSKTHWRE